MKHISTEEAADRLMVRPATIRAGYCRDKHYLGMVPVKLPNRRLLWDAAEVEALSAPKELTSPKIGLIDPIYRTSLCEAARLASEVGRLMGEAMGMLSRMAWLVKDMADTADVAKGKKP